MKQVETWNFYRVLTTRAAFSGRPMKSLKRLVWPLQIYFDKTGRFSLKILNFQTIRSISWKFLRFVQDNSSFFFKSWHHAKSGKIITHNSFHKICFGLIGRDRSKIVLRLPTDESLAYEAAVVALGLKANVSEADHPLLCEGTRRQRGELAIALLTFYKDDSYKICRWVVFCYLCLLLIILSCYLCTSIKKSLNGPRFSNKLIKVEIKLRLRTIGAYHEFQIQQKCLKKFCVKNYADFCFVTRWKRQNSPEFCFLLYSRILILK